MVGGASANALVLTRAADEVVLVDAQPERAVAEAEDVRHATPFANNALVRAGGYDELAGVDVVVISAGVPQRPGETRLQLLEAIGYGEAQLANPADPASGKNRRIEVRAE